MPDGAPSLHSRRGFIRLAAASGVGGLLLACGGDVGSDEPEPDAAATPAEPARLTTATPEVRRAPAEPESPRAVATPTPPPPVGRAEIALLGRSEWETPLFVTHSGVAGPVVLVLGGVHGNEPGGWEAAEAIAGWTPSRGSLLVIPRANVVATQALERTLPELGDLNRLYPGSSADELPMSRMAASIVYTAKRYGVDLVLDLHESWGFYAERGENGGTAFIGQTITSGPGPEREPIARTIAGRFNAQVEVERDRLLSRDRSSFPAGIAEDEPLGDGADAFRWRPGRGGSSLSLGRLVPGVTPVLIEMGQERQALARRAELHQLVTRTALQLLEMA